MWFWREVNLVKTELHWGTVQGNFLGQSIRSEYFRVMFSSNFVESSSGQVKLPYPKAVVDKVVSYLYTGKMVFEDLELGPLLDLLDS